MPTVPGWSSSSGSTGSGRRAATRLKGTGSIAASMPGEGPLRCPTRGSVKAARSVELSSERLGIIAQLDLLEGEDGGVVPVDTKKGRPGPGYRPGGIERTAAPTGGKCSPQASL